MFYVGCFLTKEGGYYGTAQKILGMGGNTYEVFTRNPMGGGVLRPDRDRGEHQAQRQEQTELFHIRVLLFRLISMKEPPGRPFRYIHNAPRQPEGIIHQDPVYSTRENHKKTGAYAGGDTR